MDRYLQTCGVALRDEVSVRADYRKSADGSYVASLSVMENNAALLSLSLTVPLEEMAVNICDNWQKKNREVYQTLTDLLFYRE